MSIILNLEDFSGGLIFLQQAKLEISIGRPINLIFAIYQMKKLFRKQDPWFLHIKF